MNTNVMETTLGHDTSRAITILLLERGHGFEESKCILEDMVWVLQAGRGPSTPGPQAKSPVYVDIMNLYT